MKEWKEAALSVERVPRVKGQVSPSGSKKFP